MARNSHSLYVVILTLSNAEGEGSLYLSAFAPSPANQDADQRYSVFFLFRAFTLNQIGVPINPKLSRI
jgi:hypothetical protein